MDSHETRVVEVRPGSWLASGSETEIRSVPFDAPWDWLAAGWRDLWRAPQISLTYGGFCTFAALLLLGGLTRFGWQSLMLPLAGGFLLLGPLVAVGLYETSRALESGEAPRLKTVLTAGLRAPGQLAFFGAVLVFAYFVWMELAFLLFMLFLGTSSLPPPSEFVQTLLFTLNGLGLLVAGTIVGGLLAALVFSISAISVPLLMTRRLDTVTAMATSLSAVARNPRAMMLWAGLIAGFSALGLGTLFLGLVIVFPLVGHATWHAFRDLTGRE